MSQSIIIAAEQSGMTLAALLRARLAGQSWTQVRRFIVTRHVKVGDDLCLDPARRLKEGEQVEVLDRPAPRRHDLGAIVIRHLDEHIVVVEKPAGMNTVRHPAERDWSERRKAQAPTLLDLVAKKLAASGGRKPPEGKHRHPARLRVVQRLDKETSGLVVFARTVQAERGLGKQFHAHTVERRYLALVPGYLLPQTIKTWLVRDRGDGRRGSIPNLSSTRPGTFGKEAITHVEVVERLPGHTLLACRLQTGRTHQIRIHLAELGHPVCGEKVYNQSTLPSPRPAAPRLALHAVELGFVHPVSGAPLRWEMPLPQDLQEFLDQLRQAATNRHAD